jgi:Zn-dependent protease
MLFAISVHESAHAWAALQNGDDTAARLGRISLNPLDHIDPIGTVLIPLIQIVYSGGVGMIGWAKPTPVFAGNFRRLTRGHILVAAAGPASNLLLALLFTAALYVARAFGLPLEQPLGFVAVVLLQSISINVVLCVFNLIPLPPLDGSWIASWGLPRSIAAQYDRIAEPYGQWILLLLVLSGGLGWLLGPVVHFFTTLLLLFLR